MVYLRHQRVHVLMRNVLLAGKGDGRRSRIGASVQGVQETSAVEADSVRLVKIQRTGGCYEQLFLGWLESSTVRFRCVPPAENVTIFCHGRIYWLSGSLCSVQFSSDRGRSSSLRFYTF